MPQLHALLIGVDCYLPNDIGGGSYPSLKGCVRDIGCVEGFLQAKLALRPENVTKLTSTTGPDSKPAESADRLPSYANIVREFQAILNRAAEEDLLYVHYSGHGGVCRTSIPAVKGATGKDETLVPYDIGDSESRYVRDHELATLFRQFAQRGIIATFVMDCCHSGGLTKGLRGHDVGVRGVDFEDNSNRNQHSDVANDDELAANWLAIVGGNHRNLLSPQAQPDYTMLAACRPTELAKEFAFDGQHRMGALTYWLLDTLQQIDTHTNWKTVHDRVCARVHSQFADQTPMLLGDPSRVLFAAARMASVYAVTVQAVDAASGLVTLNGGQANGVRSGSQFVIYPLGTQDFSRPEQRMALLEVVNVGAVNSEARIVQTIQNREIGPGAQAVLLTAPSQLTRRVRFLTAAGAVPGDNPRFVSLRQALAGNGWIEETTSPDVPADFVVTISDDDQNYEICNAEGSPLKLRPIVALAGPEAETTVVKRLVHLARFLAVKQLDNFSSTSPLRDKLTVELLTLPNNFEEGVDDPNQVGTLTATPIVLHKGQKACLRISNRSTQVLNVAVMDLQPDWGITQIYPTDATFEPLAAGDAPILLTFTSDLPPDYDTGIDHVKVFATLGTTSFKSLELPALDRPAVAYKGQVGADPLEQLLAAIESDTPQFRNINLAGASREWTMGQIEIAVKQ